MKYLFSIAAATLLLTIGSSAHAKSIAPPSAMWTMSSLAEALNTRTDVGRQVAAKFDEIDDTNITAAQYKGSKVEAKADGKGTIRRDTYLIVGSKSAVKLVRVVDLSEPREPWRQSSILKTTYEITPFRAGETTTVE